GEPSGDEHATESSSAHLDNALPAEAADGLAHRCSRHVELLDELTLRGQLVALAELAEGDRGEQLVNDLVDGSPVSHRAEERFSVSAPAGVAAHRHRQR